MVNKKEISTEFIGDWFHVSAVVDFGTGKVDIVLTNEAGLTAEVNDLDFYSGNDINSIGSYYVDVYKRQTHSRTVQKAAVSEMRDVGPL